MPFDTAGRMISLQDARGGLTTGVFDNANRVITSVSPLGYRTSIVYSAARQRIATVDALGYYHTSVFDPVGRVEASVDPLGHATSTIFDALGQAIGQADALANRTSAVFDAIGRTIVQQDARGFLTSFVFDADSEQIAVVDANNHIISNVFDPRGNLLSIQDALGAFISWAYDPVGNIVLRTDARNAVTSYTLDALNRTVGQLYPDSTRVTNTFDAARQQLTQQDSIGIRSFSWDLDGRQIGVVDPTGMTLTYTLDPVGNRILLVDPNAGLTSYSWDAQNRQVGIVNPFAEWTTVSYDALNRELLKTLGNGMSVSHSYDAAGRETVLGNFSSAGAALAVFTSTFDAANNRLTVLDMDGSRTTYGYDPSYQLVSEQRSGSNLYNTSFQYDALGNRVIANQNGSITSSSYDAANELVLLTPASGMPTTSSHDPNGNLTLENAGGSLTSYSWDFENRLIGVAYPTGQRQTFGYAANGHRNQFTIPGSGLAHHLLSTNAGLVTQVHYTNNPGYWGGLVSQNQNGVSTFYGFDGPGNTRILVGSAGSVLAVYLYEAFGLELLSPTASNVYWFGGQYGYQRDWPNRCYVRARHLETANGRWISRDPIGFDGGDWNLYRYVSNNPPNSVDYSGLACSAQKPKPIPKPPHYEGCTGNQDKQITKAINSMCKKLKTKPSSTEMRDCLTRWCHGSPAYPNDLFDHLGTFSCTNCNGNKGKTENDDGCAYTLGDTQLCPDTFDNSRCGGVECNVVHELCHQCYNFGKPDKEGKEHYCQRTAGELTGCEQRYPYDK
jgi:RHS repeat-associated protein